jgi:hypothetical protein
LSLLRDHLSGQATWTEDRDHATPGRFAASFETEQSALRDRAAIIDLSHMGVVQISGPDRENFLHGLITQQVKGLGTGQCHYAQLLTPQGRFAWDFTLLNRDESLFLVTEPDRVPALVRHLTFFRLRSQVNILDQSQDWGIIGVAGPEADAVVQTVFRTVAADQRPRLGALWPIPENTTLLRDPRHIRFGWRILTPAHALADLWNQLTRQAPPAGWHTWEHYRIQHALPRGGAEWIPEQTLPLEAGLLEMNGVSFTKGCYMGQETTARTHNRGTIRKRLYRLQGTTAEGSPPTPGTPILLPNGKEAGILTSLSQQDETCIALALLRVSDLETRPELQAASYRFTANKPDWACW